MNFTVWKPIFVHQSFAASNVKFTALLPAGTPVGARYSATVSWSITLFGFSLVCFQLFRWLAPNLNQNEIFKAEIKIWTVITLLPVQQIEAQYDVVHWI